MRARVIAAGQSVKWPTHGGRGYSARQGEVVAFIPANYMVGSRDDGRVLGEFISRQDRYLIKVWAPFKRKPGGKWSYYTPRADLVERQNPDAEMIDGDTLAYFGSRV